MAVYYLHSGQECSKGESFHVQVSKEKATLNMHNWTLTQ